MERSKFRFTEALWIVSKLRLEKKAACAWDAEQPQSVFSEFFLLAIYRGGKGETLLNLLLPVNL